MLQEPKGDPLEVNRKHLEFMLTKIFTFPRNHQFDKVSSDLLNIQIQQHIYFEENQF